MEIFLFIALAVLWGLLLLPSILGSRKEAPINTTQHFARNTERLNAVRVAAGEAHLLHRKTVLARRRRALLGLAGLAVATLGAAIWTGSLTLLFVNLGVDMMLAAYIAILLQIKEQARTAAPVTALEVAPIHSAEQAQVRVVAG